MSKFALVFVLALWVCSVAGQEPKKIKIGYPAISYDQIHINLFVKSDNQSWRPL